MDMQPTQTDRVITEKRRQRRNVQDKKTCNKNLFLCVFWFVLFRYSSKKTRRGLREERLNSTFKDIIENQQKFHYNTLLIEPNTRGEKT